LERFDGVASGGTDEVVGVVLREVLEVGECGEGVLFEGLDGKEQGLSDVRIGVMLEVGAERGEGGEEMLWFEAEQRACGLKAKKAGFGVVFLMEQREQGGEVMPLVAAEKRGERGDADVAFVVVERELKSTQYGRGRLGDASKGADESFSLAGIVEAWPLK
jgi:hypothetical protein